METIMGAHGRVGKGSNQSRLWFTGQGTSLGAQMHAAVVALESFGLQVRGHARKGAVLDLNQATHLAQPGALPFPHHARDGRT